MCDDFKTNLFSFGDALSQVLDGFRFLADHCPEPDSDCNDFLCTHVATVLEFLNYELFLTTQRLEMEVNDD